MSVSARVDDRASGMAVASPARAILLTWPVPAIRLTGHGAGHPLLRARGQRIAYASVGEGPLLLFGGRWVTHLEEEWADPQGARVLRGARAATSRRPVRPDRRGALGSAPCRPADARVRARDPGCGACRLRRRAGDDLRLLLCRSGDDGICKRVPGAHPQDRVLRRLCLARRHPRSDAPLARRLRPHELAARRPDAGGALPPSRQRRRDRGVEPLSAPFGRGGGRRRVSRSRSESRMRARSCQR